MVVESGVHGLHLPESRVDSTLKL